MWATFLFLSYAFSTAVNDPSSGGNPCAKFSVITQGDCADSDLLPIFDLEECAMAAMCSGLVESIDGVQSQHAHDRPFGCRYQSYGSSPSMRVFINDKPFPNTGASEAHRLLCKQQDVATESCVWTEAAASNTQIAENMMNGAAPGDSLSDDQMMSNQFGSLRDGGFIECETSAATFELVHGGLCAETERAVPNTNQRSVTECRDHCALHVMDGYFAFSGRHCICYQPHTGCPQGSGYVHYNAYRIIYEFGFKLFGDMGSERVIITDGSKVIGPVTLTTESTKFIANNREITIHYDDADNANEDANVFFVSPEYNALVSNDERPRLGSYTREFNWSGQYNIEFQKRLCEVTVFEHRDFNSRSPDSWSATFGEGDYTLRDLRDAGVVNDEMSSVSISHIGDLKCCVEFWEDGDFTGDDQTKCESDDYLRTLNDDISSMKIFFEDKEFCRLDSHCEEHQGTPADQRICEDGVCVTKPCEKRSDCDWIERNACENRGKCDLSMKCHRESGECTSTEKAFEGEDCWSDDQCHGDLNCLWWNGSILKKCGKGGFWGIGRRQLADDRIAAYESWRRTL